MKRHVFVTARTQPIPRWLEAFPNALLVCGQDTNPTDSAPLQDASVIWLHVTTEGHLGADWVSEVRATVRNIPIVV